MQADLFFSTTQLQIFSFHSAAAGDVQSSVACPPTVTLDTPANGASQVTGHVYGGDLSKLKVVVYALTNQWYVQPLTTAPYTNIAADGSWTTSTAPWDALVVLVVDPTSYTPQNTEITNPSFDPGVLASTQYPGAASLSFSGQTWGVKMTGSSAPSDRFDPGPNYWSSDPSVVNAAPDGLHLKIAQVNGVWQSGEVYLLNSLGYGTYTVQVNSHLDALDQNTVAAPLFIYAAPGQELDNEYSGSGGLIPAPNDAQFVVQPFTVPGNLLRYVQRSTAQFTSQIEWGPEHVTFRAWNGWAASPAASDVIKEWTYTGSNIPPVGQERVHINLWLLNGNAPVKGTGDGMVISSFSFQPRVVAAIQASPPSLTFDAGYGSGASAPQTVNVTSAGDAVFFTVASDSPWLTTQTPNGTTPAGVGVTAAPGAMTPGTYNGTLTFTAGSFNASVAVKLIVVEPSLSISSSHTGNFVLGEANANYSLTVSNATGAGLTTGVVTVTETAPAGLTFVTMTGTGWACNGNSCMRNDGLNGGASYPAIVVTVNVSANAAPAVVNQVSVTGGGSPSASGLDLTDIRGPSTCDVDLDELVTISDIQKLINEALGLVATGNDLNHDGVVNMVDVQIAANATVGLGCSAQ